MTASLTDRQRDILDFEARWWQESGNKIQAIVDDLGMKPEAYFQALAQLVDSPAAEKHRPEVVRALRAARDRRRREVVGEEH
ncbi:DUF3263 domain-containing protein [Haloglycomyces albus]|uniref:DUF3263 domain-containing protein n=1 Tax=Haloglycomyces albus TaxID=526067 RepID=UPI00046D8D6B|nr:DUF3263 domain-containing protein [Haloglycomyces albus]